MMFLPRKSSAFRLLSLFLLACTALALDGSGVRRGKGSSIRRFLSSPASSSSCFENVCDFFRNTFQRLIGTTTPETEASPNEFDNPTEFFDVIIIGGGIAGLAAAAELAATDPDLTYVILESTDRIGGRVRSHTMGAPGREVLVEDGANWIYPVNGNNPVWNVGEDISLERFPQDFLDFVTFDEMGSIVDQSVVDDKIDEFEAAFDAAAFIADEDQYTSDHENFPDDGVVQLIADQGFEVSADSSGNLDYIIKWLYLDFEYGVEDVSVRYFPPEVEDPHYVTDQRGFEAIINQYQADNVPADRIRLSHRVKTVHYDVSLENEGTTYCALLETTDEANDVARDFYGQRVISTVSQGVLNSGDIDFQPAFTYAASEYNPFEMAQYVKVFYQFNTTFWNDTEFVEIMRDVPDRGHCHHWQNMDLFIPGSGLIRCELMTEAFEELIDPDTQELSSATLDALLDPLRIAYGNETVGTPLDVYYPKLNLDVDYGYGAFAYWKIGVSFTDFAKFFGGIEILTPYCDHNGCNGNDDWVLHLSGSATCFRFSELVHGGFFSGVRSAKFVLESLGYDGIDAAGNECDIFWVFLEFAPPTFLERLFGGQKDLEALQMEKEKLLKARREGLSKRRSRGSKQSIRA